MKISIHDKAASELSKLKGADAEALVQAIERLQIYKDFPSLISSTLVKSVKGTSLPLYSVQVNNLRLLFARMTDARDGILILTAYRKTESSAKSMLSALERARLNR